MTSANLWLRLLAGPSASHHQGGSTEHIAPKGPWNILFKKHSCEHPSAILFMRPNSIRCELQDGKSVGWGPGWGRSLPSLDFLIHKVSHVDLTIGFRIGFREALGGALGGLLPPHQSEVFPFSWFHALGFRF